ncbi:hypothetical protein MTP04_31210 [Lysinibacillus sp. PLM2]|nr:hypothetical protein MTP04_31210 [Lysinibacillus sp. PLM2]
MNHFRHKFNVVKSIFFDILNNDSLLHEEDSSMNTLIMIVITGAILTAIFTAGYEGNYSNED